MNDILFSILIANFNGEKYLKECFDSIINQSYTKIEIVIVDDCSTDNSENLIKNFIKSTKYKTIYERNQKNKGCGYTKSRLVELATGEICGFLDSDDSLDKDAVQTMVSYHKMYLNCCLISSRYFICNDKLKKLYPSPIINKSNFVNYLLSPRLTHFNTFKRMEYLKTNGINKDISHGVDQDLCLKLEEIGDILFVPEVLYNYRTYNKSISHGAGGQKATFYNLLIRIDACRRRKINESIISNVYRFEVPMHNFVLTKCIHFIKYVIYICFIKNKGTANLFLIEKK